VLRLHSRTIEAALISTEIEKLRQIKKMPRSPEITLPLFQMAVIISGFL
jgi:hypothetical protein